jgi:hypothetical protein
MRTAEIVLAMLVFVFGSVASAATIGLGGAPSSPDNSGYEAPPITGPLPWMPVLPEPSLVTTQNPVPSPVTPPSDPPCIGGSPSCYSETTPQKSIDLPASVPEASTWAMMILGFCSLGLIAYRRRTMTLIRAESFPFGNKRGGGNASWPTSARTEAPDPTSQ